MDLAAEEPIRWLNRIVKKDRAAFELFYDRYSPLVFGLALKILRNRQEAEEAMQDVFYQVWTNADKYKQDKGVPEAWLCVMTRSRALDRLRAARRRLSRVATTEDGSSPDGAVAPAPLDARAAVGEALAGLSELQRQAIEWTYFEGMTQTEIAAKFAIPLGTVKTRVRDALRKLRELHGNKKAETR